MKVLSELRYLPRAHDGEHWFLYSQIDALIKAEFVEKFKLAVFHSPFKAGFGDENESYSAVTKSVTTETIALTDDRRDKGLRRLDLGVQYATLSDDAAKSDAAKRCMVILDLHRGAASKSYAENTAAVADVVERFQSDAYKADIETLGLTDEVAALKALNDEFQTVYMSRLPEQYARSTREATRSVRQRVDAAFEDLADAINAIYIMKAYIEPVAEDAAEIKALADAINAAIYQFQLTLARRGVGKTPSDGEEETPGEPENPDGGEGGDEGTDLPFEPTDPNPDEGGDDEEETPSVV